MRGEHALIQGVPAAVAVLDLALAGVHAEMGEVPFDWFGAVAAKEKVAAAPVVAKVAALEPLPLKREEEPVKVAKPLALVENIPGVLWEEGEPGGVVLVMCGQQPDEACKKLGLAMLAAVGLGDSPVAWVGYTGGIGGAELRRLIGGKVAVQVLLLGQAPLGVLLGKSLGVEGWHAAGGGELPEWTSGPVGVTYPLDLLMKQPLFKRLAWQHLLAWGETPGVVATRSAA